MRYHVLEREKLSSFIEALAKEKKIVAPIKKSDKSYVFREVKSFKDISLDYIPTILPPKKYFMPEKEKLLSFELNGKDVNEKAVISDEKIALFGVHTCDLSGIQCLNIVFNDKPIDHNFVIRKENIFIIGLECNKYCDEYASCALLNSHLPNGGYDLFFTNLGDRFIINVNTQDGEDFVEKIKIPLAMSNDISDLEKIREQKRKIFKNEINLDSKKIPEIFEKSYNSKVWEEIGSRCISCGNCTSVCPTCYCFDVYDTINLDMKSGFRTRVWDSCQFETFAAVAGGENFREERSLRQRHRVYRKFKFPYDRYNRFFCTGCGRCSRTCMAGINLKDILVRLSEEVKF